MSQILKLSTKYILKQLINTVIYFIVTHSTLLFIKQMGSLKINAAKIIPVQARTKLAVRIKFTLYQKGKGFQLEPQATRSSSQKCVSKIK